MSLDRISCICTAGYVLEIGGINCTACNTRLVCNEPGQTVVSVTTALGWNRLDLNSTQALGTLHALFVSQ